jgi:multicomponent Na+:H+ antiporter subunit B
VSRSRARALIALPVLGVLGGLLVWAVTGIPGFGDYHHAYGRILNHVAVPERHTDNVVNAVVFDYRGVDTMGEEFILFAAVLGVVLLLRIPGRESGEEKALERVVDAVASDGLRVLGLVMLGVSFLVGIWLVTFGFITPGGGFQGGVIVAGSLVLLYAAVSFRAWHRLSREKAFDPIKGFGVGAYAVVGLAAFAAGLPFLHDLAANGKAGTLFSGGSLPYLNLATAIEVAAANVVLCAEFLNQVALRLAGRR